MTFDDLKPYDELARCYFEEVNYKTNVPNYTPQLNPEYRTNRTGAEEEYFTSGASGSFEKPDPLFLPSTCLKMFDFNFEKFVTPHHSLRVFIKLPERSEIDPDFALLPEKIEFQDGLDPQNIDDLDVLKYEFISKTPGFFGIHAVNAWNVEMPNYFKERTGKTYGEIDYYVLFINIKKFDGMLGFFNLFRWDLKNMEWHWKRKEKTLR